MPLTEAVLATAPEAFSAEVPAGGYRWWYADALSEDGAYGLTLIAFIGSVFSPYYAWSGRRQPQNHCAINIALYGPDRQRWAMTERGVSDLDCSPGMFRLGPSRLYWQAGALIAEIAEYGMPLPFPVRGQIRLTPHFKNRETFPITPDGQHLWCPVAPAASVEAAFTHPRLNWRGQGYLDTNSGREPLESAFEYWDWARLSLSGGRTATLYNTELTDGTRQELALIFGADGRPQRVPAPPEARLPPTPVFRIARRTRCDAGARPHLLRTLEDTPFYSRSIIETRIFGEAATGVHESILGGRLRSPLVRLMLPFRMPRRARAAISG
jgi:carotenoid 1,2-hydratase